MVPAGRDDTGRGRVYAPVIRALAAHPASRRALALWLFIATFVVAWAPSADGDIWWHLAAGREMVRTHALLWTDPFSSGAAGRPWIDVHWLFQLAVYAIHAVAGLRGLVVVKCAMVATGVLVLRAAVVQSPAGRRAEPLFAVAMVAALFLCRQLLLVRPIIPTLLLLAVFFQRLESFRRRGHVRTLLWLPILQIVWSNLQGLAVLGPALVAAFAGGALLCHLRKRGDGAVVARQSRWLLACLAGCLLACLLTPYGLGAPRLAWQLLLRLVPGVTNVYSANIAENVPPWSLGSAAREQFWHLRWFLAFLAVSFIVGRRRLLASHCFIAVAVVALAIIANRNILLLYWLATPIAAMNYARGWRTLTVWLRRRWRRRWPMLVATATLVPVGLLGLTIAAAAAEPTIARPAPWRAPVHSADIIERRAGSGTIFAADNYGGYLIWRLYPRFRPYMDTRLVLRSADEFAEYLALADDPGTFDAWEQRFPFDYVLLPTAYPDRYLGLVAHLYQGTTWDLIFTDGTETLFARASAANESWDLRRRATTDRILDDLAARFAGEPRLHQAARLQLAVLELAIDSIEEADRAVAGLRTADADVIRARGRLASGDSAGARAIAERLLSSNPDDGRPLDILALLAIQRGDLREATALVRRALAVDPSDPDALRILARLERAATGTR
ncbi:MAG TPA: tetratricopeptide repeat protein [Polyangia bacterium]|nr:tetratricopeptide repeat protein [Polyangia bacterium]